jgi:hypothetical protein
MSEPNYVTKMNTAEGAPPPQVAICIPTGRQCEADMTMAFGGITARAAAQGVRTITLNRQSSSVVRARNDMVAEGLAMGATHFMWIDSDNTPPIDVISRFLAHDKDIVGAVYCRRSPPYGILGIPLGPVDFAAVEGLVPYFTLPGGCIMVKAKIYRTIPAPHYFDTIRRDGETPFDALIALINDNYRLPLPVDIVNSMMTYTSLNKWLAEEQEENKTKYGNEANYGEDTNFCLKAKRHGFDIWCDIDVSCLTGHTGSQTVVLSRSEKKVE